MKKIIILLFWMIFLITSVSAWYEPENYWREDGNQVDSGSNPNNLTIVGTERYQTGKIGQAFEFNQSDSTHLVNLSEEFNANGIRTLDFWIYMGHGEADQNMIHIGTGNGTGIVLQTQLNSWQIKYGECSINTVVGAWSLRTWQHMVITIDAVNGFNFSVNNIEELSDGSCTTALPITYDSIILGCHPNGGSCSREDNLIDNIFLTNFSYSPDNTTTSYNGGNALNFLGQAPTLTVEQLYPSDNSRNNTNTINFSYTPISYNSTLANCSLLINGVINQTNTSITNNTINFIETTLAEDYYNGSISCFDINGTSANSTNISFQIDTTPPPITWNNPYKENIHTAFNLTLNININHDNLSQVLINITNSSGTIISTERFTGLDTLFNLSNVYNFTYTDNYSIIINASDDGELNTVSETRYYYYNASLVPNASLVTLIPDTPYGNQDLTCSFTFQTFDYSVIGNTNYSWFNNTILSPEFATNTVFASNLTMGDNWTCQIIPVDNNSIQGFAVNSSTVQVVEVASFSSPIITYNATYPLTPLYNQPFFLDTDVAINITARNISSVNFTLIDPSGNVVLFQNGTYSGSNLTSKVGKWVSSSYTPVGYSGQYNWTIYVQSNSAENTTDSGNFIVNDTVFYSPLNFLSAPEPREENSSFNISLWHESLEPNASYELTIQMDNLSCFLPSLENASIILGNTTINTSTKIQVDIVTNCSSVNVSDGLYTGQVNITRILTGERTIIPISIGINPPAGDINAYDLSNNLCGTGDLCSLIGSIQDDATLTKEWRLTNDGNFTLTGCTPRLTNDFTLETFYSFNDTDFDIPIGNTTDMKVTFSSPAVGVHVGFLDVECHATVLGYNNSLSDSPFNQPTIQLSVVSAPVILTGTPGGGGTTTECTTDAKCIDSFGSAYYCQNSKCLLNTSLVSLETCDYNGICEFERGETVWNCKCDTFIGCGNLRELSGDCKTSSGSDLFTSLRQQRVIWILGAIFIVAVLYIFFVSKEKEINKMINKVRK